MCSSLNPETDFGCVLCVGVTGSVPHRRGDLSALITERTQSCKTSGQFPACYIWLILCIMKKCIIYSKISKLTRLDLIS